MFTWFFFAVFSALVLAGSEISQKISMTQKLNISAVTNNFFTWFLQAFYGSLILLFVGGFNFDFSVKNSLLLALLGIFYFLGGTCYYTSFKGNSPSISAMLGSISVLVSTSIGVILFEERLSIYKLLGIFLVVSAIFIINYSKEQKFNKYNLLALAGGLFFGIAYSTDKALVVSSSPSSYFILMCLSAGLACFIFKSKTIIKEASQMKLINFLPIIFAATFGTLFNIFTFIAYSKDGDVGSIDAINNSSILIVILVEVLLFKDKKFIKKKMFCALLALVGILLLRTN